MIKYFCGRNIRFLLEANFKKKTAVAVLAYQFLVIGGQLYLQYNIKCHEAIVVVTWYYMSKTELN